MEVHAEEITPRLAEEMLKEGAVNRNLRPSVAGRYATDMAAGNWHETGDPIKFNTLGRLIDGQHRLAAIVASGVTLKLFIATNVPDEAMLSIDVGETKTLGDHLHIVRNETSARNLAAAIRFSWLWAGGGTLHGRAGPTVSQAFNWLDLNPGIRDHVSTSGAYARKVKISGTVLAVFAHQVTLVDPTEAKMFMAEITSDVGHEEGSASLALRRWALGHHNRQTTAGKPGPDTYLAMTIKAWNAWIQGTPIQVLSWRRGGGKKEKFPQLLNLDGFIHEIRNELDE